MQQTFLFADLVGYTAFTERLGGDAADDDAVAFQAAAAHMAADLDSAATRTCPTTRDGLTIADRGGRSFNTVAAPLSIFSAA